MLSVNNNKWRTQGGQRKTKDEDVDIVGAVVMI